MITNQKKKRKKKKKKKQKTNKQTDKQQQQQQNLPVWVGVDVDGTSRPSSGAPGDNILINKHRVTIDT